MLSKIILTLVALLVTSISFAHGDEQYCYPWEDWTCVPGQAFSVENVHQVHDMLGREGPPVLAASLQGTESRLVYIGGFETALSSPVVLQWENDNEFLHGPRQGIRLGCYPSFHNRSDDFLVGPVRGGGLEVLDRSEGDSSFVIPVSSGEFTELLFHPKGAWLLVVVDHAHLFQVDLKMRSVSEINLKMGEDQVLDTLTLSSDGQLLAAAGGGTITVWKTDSWKMWERQPMREDTVEVLRFTDDDSHLLVSAGETIDRWSVTDKTLTFVEQTGLFGCFLTFTTLAVTSDAVIVGTTVGSILVWDLLQEKFLFELHVDTGEITELLLDPAGTRVLVVIGYSKLFQVDLELRSVRAIHLQDSEKQALDAVASSNDGLLLAAAGNGKLGVWDTSSWEAWEPQPIPGDTVGILRIADDDTHLLVSTGATVSRWSLLDGSLVFDQQLDSYAGRRQCTITAGDVSHDGRLLITGDDCGQYRAWDLAAGAEIYIPQLHDSLEGVPVNVLEFSLDGRVLSVGSYYGFGLLIIHQPE